MEELSKELRLYQKIVQFFVPEAVSQKISDISTWNEDVEDWVIPRFELAGNLKNAGKSVHGFKSP